MVKILCYSYSSWHWPTLRFLHNSYVGQWWPLQSSPVHWADHLAVCGTVCAVDSLVLNKVYDITRKLWYTAFQQYMVHLHSLSESKDMAKSSCSEHLQWIKWTIQPSVVCVVDSPVLDEVYYITKMLWYTAFQQYMVDLHKLPKSKDMAKSGRSKHLQWIEWTIWLSMACAMDGPLLYGLYYMIRKLWYTAFHDIQYICIDFLSPKIWLKAATPVISSKLSGPSHILWYVQQTVWHCMRYIISLECCDIQLSNSIWYICIDFLSSMEWLKVAAPGISSALSGPSSFLWYMQKMVCLCMGYITWLGSCDIHLSNGIQYILLRLSKFKDMATC